MILLPDGRFYSSVLVIYNLYVGAAHLVFCETKYSSHQYSVSHNILFFTKEFQLLHHIYGNESVETCAFLMSKLFSTVLSLLTSIPNELECFIVATWYHGREHTYINQQACLPSPCIARRETGLFQREMEESQTDLARPFCIEHSNHLCDYYLQYLGHSM